MNDFWFKAIRAARTARAALAMGDTDGAVSRAYYAMFDAAKAALESIDPTLAEAKSQDAIIARFGEYVVLGRGLDRDLGRALNSGQDLRHVADYDRTPVSLEEATQTIDRMERLLSAVAELMGETAP